MSVEAAGVVKPFREALQTWYGAAQRDLPWRRTRDPYAVWLSETMLQQTRVETVVPYYERFLRELPTIQALADASQERVLALWSGLGYYRRARMLHAAARRLTVEHGGQLPSDVATLRGLEGVGAYTAGAVASIAFGRREAVVDGNVARVLARLYGVRDDVKSTRGAARLWRLAERLVSESDDRTSPGDWNQALMELGAVVCLPRAPRCEVCPVRGACVAHASGTVDELPRVGRARAPVAMRRIAVVLASGRAILLARRRVDTLFGGLWEPPATGSDLVAFARRLHLDPPRLKRMGQVVHVLSHRRMEVEVVRGPLGRRLHFDVPSAEYDAVEVVTLARLAERARATLTRKILEVANVP